MENYPDWVLADPNNPNWPWNMSEEPAEEIELDITVSNTLSKDFTITTFDAYRMLNGGGPEEQPFYAVYTENCDFRKDFDESGELDIPAILEKTEELTKIILDLKLEDKKINYLCRQLNQAVKGWNLDDDEYVES